MKILYVDQIVKNIRIVQMSPTNDQILGRRILMINNVVIKTRMHSPKFIMVDAVDMLLSMGVDLQTAKNAGIGPVISEYTMPDGYLFWIHANHFMSEMIYFMIITKEQAFKFKEEFNVLTIAFKSSKVA